MLALKKVSGSLNMIEAMLLKGDVDNAINAIRTLNDATSKLGRNIEVLDVAYVHSKETVSRAQQETFELMSRDYLHIDS